MKLHTVYIPDLCFCHRKLPYSKVEERHVEIDRFINNIMMAFIIYSLLDSNIREQFAISGKKQVNT